MSRRSLVDAAGLLGNHEASKSSRVVPWALFAVSAPTAILRTVGAHSGRRRRHLVVSFRDGERMTLVATKLGAADHPAWFHDALAHPEVTLGGRPYRAEVVAESDRDRLWPMADHVFPPYAAYRETASRTGRPIPILHLVPR